MFQLFAFDMILDKDMKVWLIDVKNAPLLRLRNKEMALKMFDYVFRINELRSSKLYDVFRRLYAEVVSLVKGQVLDITKHQAFISGLRNHLVLKKERDQVKASMRYYADYVKPPSDFDCLYDGRIGYENLSSPSLEIERFRLKLKYSKVNRV
jgi:hypothetical protein